MRALFVVPLVAVSLHISAAAKAQGLADANTAFDRRDYSRAFELYEPLARTGDAAAESALGAMYYFGNGVERNWTRAYMWFSLAAQSSSATGIVAKTNRDVISGRMAPADIKAAQSMADQCLASEFQQCGLIRFADR